MGGFIGIAFLPGLSDYWFIPRTHDCRKEIFPANAGLKDGVLFRIVVNVRGLNLDQKMGPITLSVRVIHARVTVRVYNALGQVVAELVNENQSAGNKFVEFDAIGVSSGLYFYRLDASGLANRSRSFSQIKKMLLIK